MNYEETITFLYSQLPVFQRVGAAAYKANLDNTHALMDMLGNPYELFKTVHIAGTNGKGSAAHMLASVYQEAGYKTGLYTSPHLKDFRERIRINGAMIPKEKVVSFVSEFSEEFRPISPSFFELTMAMAFWYFANQKVDIVILETGMGGRLDSTNVVSPELSVITNIGFDHMQFLGDTLSAIAGEKAGIIKAGIPVLIGEKQTEIESVFRGKAKELKAPLYYAQELIELKAHKDRTYQVFLKGEPLFESISIPLLGSYQSANLRTVLAASYLLALPKEAIQKGIEKVVENTGIMGRWQVLKQQPLCICDTAHNVDGLRYVVKQLAVTPYKTLHFVLGVVNDKAIEHILELLPQEAVYYFCKANIPRGLDANLLQEKAEKAGLQGSVYESVQTAYTAAKSAATASDLVFVGGSTFTVAEVV